MTQNLADGVAVADLVGQRASTKQRGKVQKRIASSHEGKLRAQPTKIEASVPARNRYRLSPQLRLRYQTRFRCELAKQTQSELGILRNPKGPYTQIVTLKGTIIVL